MLLLQNVNMILYQHSMVILKMVNGMNVKDVSSVEQIEKLNFRRKLWIGILDK